MSARFDRRRFLLGSSSFLALPFFESLHSSRALAQGMPTVPTSCAWLVFPEGILSQGMYPNLAITDANGNTRYDAFNHHIWEVTGTENAFQLPATLAPLAPFKNDVLFATHGFKPNKGTAVDEGGGTGHSYGTSSYLTDVVFTMSGNTIVGGRSVDALVAEALGVSASPGWLVLGSDVTNFDRGFEPELNNLPVFDKTISWSSPSQAADQLTNVQTVFDRLFPSSMPTTTESPKARGKRSVLDFLRGEATSFKGQLNRADQAKLDEYLTSVREVEQRVATSDAGVPAATCTPGTRPPAIDSLMDFETHTRTMIDLIYLGIACGRSRVVSYLMDRDRTDRIVPGVFDISRHTCHHHSDFKDTDVARANAHRAQHNQGSQWFLQRYADLIGKLKAHDLGGGRTLLDTTMVAFGTNFGEYHGFRGVPYFIAGRGGGMRPGRFISGGNYTQNDTWTKSAQLWLGMARKMGVNLPAIGRTTQAWDI